MANTARTQGDAISYSKNETEWNLGGRDKRNLVIVDVYTTWTILVGIFFPSVTGEPMMKDISYRRCCPTLK